jgi:hypothetical protein
MIFRAKISPLRHGGLAGDAGDLGADQSGACCKEDAGLIDCRLFHSGATTLGPYRGQVFQEALAEYGATANRSAIRVARDTRWPHPAIHMIAWLKSHFFCFLLLIGHAWPSELVQTARPQLSLLRDVSRQTHPERTNKLPRLRLVTAMFGAKVNNLIVRGMGHDIRCRCSNRA